MAAGSKITTPGGTISLSTSGGAITQSAAGTTLFGLAVSLGGASTSNVGSALINMGIANAPGAPANQPVTLTGSTSSAGAGIFVTSAASMNIGAAGVTSTNGTVALTSGSTGLIAQTAVTGTVSITGHQVTLKGGTGGLGDPTTNLTLSGSLLTANTTGAAFLDSPAAVTFAGASSAGGAAGFNMSSNNAVTFASGATLATAAGSISIGATSVSFLAGAGKVLNAGAHAVNLYTTDTGSGTIVVGGSTGTFPLSTTMLQQISAGTLTVGSPDDMGGLTVASPLNVSGSGSNLIGSYNLSFTNGGSYSAGGNAITLGAKSLTIATGSTATLGPVSGGAATVSVNAAGGSTATSNTLTLKNSLNAMRINANLNVFGGSMLLQSSNAANGAITFANNATLNTKVLSGQPTAGTITVAVGPLQPASITPYGGTSTITVSATGHGNAFLGSTTPAAAIQGPASSPDALLNAHGSNILLISPVGTSSTISFGNGTTLTADPPVGGAGLLAPTVNNAVSQTGAGSGAALKMPYVPTFHETFNPAGASNYEPALSLPGSPVVNGADINAASFSGSAAAPGTAAAPAGAGVPPASSPLERAQDARAPRVGQLDAPAPEEFDPENIILFDGLSFRTNDEIAPRDAKLPVENVAGDAPSCGAVPAAGARHAWTQGDLQPISYVVPTAARLEGAAAPRVAMLTSPVVPGAFASKDARTSNMLARLHACGVEAGLGVNGATVELRKGSILFTPERALAVESSFGRITIGAGAVVLVVALHNGVAIYDLHDSHAGDVTLSTQGHTVCLAPGHHVLTARQGITSYEQVNPLAAVGHRNLHVKDCGHGTRQFSSEFSLVSALNGLRPLVQMKQSNNARDARIIKEIMKDAAIIQTTRRFSGTYRRMAASRTYVTAQR